VCVRDHNDRTALHIAAIRGSKRCVQYILQHHRKCINLFDKNQVSKSLVSIRTTTFVVYVKRNPKRGSKTQTLESPPPLFFKPAPNNPCHELISDPGAPLSSYTEPSIRFVLLCFVFYFSNTLFQLFVVFSPLVQNTALHLAAIHDSPDVVSCLLSYPEQEILMNNKNHNVLDAALNSDRKSVSLAIASHERLVKDN